MKNMDQVKMSRCKGLKIKKQKNGGKMKKVDQVKTSRSESLKN